MEGQEEPMRDFKKNRNMSTNSSNGGSPPPPPISINIGPNMAYLPSQQQVNSPTLPPNAKPIIYVDSARKEGKVGEEHKLIIEGVRLAM
jgi:hypothetical protein